MLKNIFFITLFVALNQVNAQYEKGDSLRNIGAYQKAIITYQQIDDSSKTDFKIAQVYQSMGDINAAISSYESGFKSDSISVLPRFRYGKLLYQNQDFPGAFNVFSSLVSQYDDNATYKYHLGKCYQELQQFDQATKSFLEAILLNKNYRSAHLELVKTYIQSNDLINAVMYSKRYLKNSPIDTKMLSYNAQASLRSKWYEQALSSFEKLIELGKVTDYNVKGIAISYLNEGKYEKAITFFDQYIADFEDDNSGVYFQKAVALMRLERYEEAINTMNKSIALKQPSLAQEYLQLAAIHARKNDLANAFKAMKQAHNENPGDALISYQLALAADRYMKDKKSIIQYYQSYVDNHGTDNTYGELAAARLSDLKKEVFMEGDSKN